MGWARLYTYAEAPVHTVRAPEDPFMAAGYAAGLPEVQSVVKGVAGIGAEVARAVLAAHVSDQKRSSKPRIELVRGERTDWHINLVVEALEGDPIAAAIGVEYGHGAYVDSAGRRQPLTQGVGALRAALEVMSLL